METPREYYYTYYSYEEWGKGYIGSRKCYCLPKEDINYFGTFKDKNFKPTQKIILKSDYATREEALDDEIILQQYYKVVENPHFSNRAYQTSTKFYVSTEQAKENGKKSIEKQKELGIGFYALTPEKIKERTKKIIEKNKKNKVSIFGLSSQELSANGKKGGSRSANQKWECLETGFVTNPGNLTKYQKSRGIDTFKRKRIA